MLFTKSYFVQHTNFILYRRFSIYFFSTSANEFAIEFPDPRGDANKVKGRLLAPPQIAYARSTATVQRGEWRMNQQDKFVLPANLPSYAIVAVGLRNAREGQAISEGFDGFIRECCRRGKFLFLKYRSRRLTFF